MYRKINYVMYNIRPYILEHAYLSRDVKNHETLIE
jgi:hypothetical protein